MLFTAEGYMLLCPSSRLITTKSTSSNYLSVLGLSGLGDIDTVAPAVLEGMQSPRQTTRLYTCLIAGVLRHSRIRKPFDDGRADGHC